MNGPLLVTLLPPEGMWNSNSPAPGYALLTALVLVAGFLLSLLLRPPVR